MKERIAVFCAAILLGSCATTTSSTDSPVITNFDDIETHIGRQVVIEGFVSRTHGASGIYLSVSDLRKENGRCVGLQPFVDTSHGDKATLSGMIEKTGCGSEKICTNICGDYQLIQSAVLSN
jgi:hypothetical protein